MLMYTFKKHWFFFLTIANLKTVLAEGKKCNHNNWRTTVEYLAINGGSFHEKINPKFSENSRVFMDLCFERDEKRNEKLLS